MLLDIPQEWMALQGQRIVTIWEVRAMMYHGRYGTVTVADHGITVYAIEPETYDWAHRPGACWPGSDLSSTTVHADFDRTGLVDLIRWEDDDLSASELSAWAFDAVQDAVPADIAAPWLRVIDPGYDR